MSLIFQPVTLFPPFCCGCVSCIFSQTNSDECGGFVKILLVKNVGEQDAQAILTTIGNIKDKIELNEELDSKVQTTTKALPANNM
jgi:hypothetical protein